MNESENNSIAKGISEYIKAEYSLYDIVQVELQTNKKIYEFTYDINKFYDKLYVRNLSKIHEELSKELQSENNKLYHDLDKICQDYSLVNRISETMNSNTLHFYKQLQKLSSAFKAYSKGHLTVKSEYVKEIEKYKLYINRFTNVKEVFNRGTTLSNFLLEEHKTARNSFIIDTKEEIENLRKFQIEIHFSYENRIRTIKKYIEKVNEIYFYIYEKSLINN